MDALKEAIKKVADTFDKEIPLFEECTVVSVDKAEKTCICKSNKRDTTYDNVKLNAIRDVGFVQYPKKDSVVIVCITNYTRFINTYSEVDHFEFEFESNKISIKENELNALIGQSKLNMTSSGFKIETNGINLGTLLNDLVLACSKITCNTIAIASPTSPPINIAEFTALIPKIKTLLK